MGRWSQARRSGTSRHIVSTTLPIPVMSNDAGQISWEVTGPPPANYRLFESDHEFGVYTQASFGPWTSGYDATANPGWFTVQGEAAGEIITQRSVPQLVET